MYVCVSMFTCVCKHVHVCVCACRGARGQHQVFSLIILHLFFETGSLSVNLEPANLVRLAGKPRDPPVSPSTEIGLQVYVATPSFWHGCWRSELGYSR